MASGEEAGQPAVASSLVGLEALFTADAAQRADGDGSPELVRLRERLRGWLSQYEPAVLWAQRLLVWERPLHSIFVGFALNTAFWLLTSTDLRPFFLISVLLIGVVLLERWQHRLPSLAGQYPETPVGERESLTERPRLLSVPELSHHLAESYFTFALYIQEMLLYKRQNHGKFCVMTCAVCLLLAVVGHYIPGLMISYIILLSVLLWPLVVYHELIQKMYTGLEPLFMKLDYSMKGGTRHRKHDKRKVKKESEESEEPHAETESESEEEELSCFAPTVDVKTTALAMAITDSELSDEEASILESGGFSVSRATTPQLSDVSEDLDQHSVHSDPEEGVSRDLPDFPPVDEFPSPGHSTEGPALEPQQGEPLSPASLLVQHLASPLHFVNTHFNGHVRAPATSLALADTPQGVSASLEALSEDLVNTAISSVVQNTLTALLSSGEGSPSTPLAAPSASGNDEGNTENMDVDTALPAVTPTPALAPTEEEDFELLDQSELELHQGDQSGSPEGQDADTGAEAGPGPGHSDPLS